MVLMETLASSAMAQQSAPASPPAPAAAAAAPSDEDIAKFGKVMLGFQELQKQGKGSDQDAMLDVVNKSGIDIDVYNAISANMRTDSALNDKVTAAYQAAVTASRPASPDAPAQN